MVTDLFARILRKMDPEQAHLVALKMLKLYGMLPVQCDQGPVEVLGLQFPGRLGLAAGFDKNAQAVAGLFRLGFSFVEIGAVDLRPWQGNPKPRIKRFPQHKAIVNHMGLPSKGVDYVVSRLKGRKFCGPVLANVAVTPDRAMPAEKAAREYRLTAERLAPHVDALVLNLSCPNTKEGRSFSSPFGARLISKVFSGWQGPPLLAKFGPAEADSEVLDAADTLLSGGFSGLVAINTKPVSDYLGWHGGLSGKPIFELAIQRVRLFRSHFPDTVIIGCGGVFGASDFLAMIDAGADLVEVFTGLILRGSGLVKEIRDLSQKD